jgi:hypothetical protein
MARRGGVKRISGDIYDQIRAVLRQHLEMIFKDVSAIVQHSGRKTVCVTDVIGICSRESKTQLTIYRSYGCCNDKGVRSTALVARRRVGAIMPREKGAEHDE